jgi:hypothetical protein
MLITKIIPPATIGIQIGKKSKEVKAARTAQTARVEILSVTV